MANAFWSSALVAQVLAIVLLLLLNQGNLIKIKMVFLGFTWMSNGFNRGKTENVKKQRERMMKYHSRTKIRPMKSLVINVLHKWGVRPSKLVQMFGVSRATIYRHLKK